MQFGYIEKSPFKFKKVKIDPSSEEDPRDKISPSTLYFSICGSDYIYSNSPIFKPRAIGHEWLGMTREGKLITAEAFWGCGRCAWCESGIDRCCRQKEIFGFGAIGASLVNFRVPIRNVAKINPDLSSKFELSLLTLLEPTAVCFNVLESLENFTSNFEGYNGVLIMGAGFLGLTMASLLSSRNMDCKFLERSKARISKINDLGFKSATKEDSDFDIVVDAAGERPITNSSAFEESIKKVRRCGVVVGLGKYVNPTKIMNGDLQDKGISVFCPRGAKEGTLSRLTEKPPNELFNLFSFFNTHSEELFDTIDFCNLPRFYSANNQLPSAIRTIVRVNNE